MKPQIPAIRVSHQRIDPIVNHGELITTSGGYLDKVKYDLARCNARGINTLLPSEEVDRLLEELR